MLEILESWGYAGMFVSAFIAGTVFPFSSEAVLTALQLAGLDPVRLFVAATAGNVAGSMLNYGVGRLGKMEWIERYLRVEPEKVYRVERWMQRYGAWIGILCFMPVVGSAVAVTMGFVRANPWLSLLTITIGKVVRYAVLIFAVAQVA